MTEQQFIPVIVGTDINAYSTARSFHEEYGVKAHVIGKLKMGFTYYSSILHLHLVEDMDTDEGFLRALEALGSQLKAENEDPALVLMGTNDAYVKLIVRHRDALQKLFLFNYVNDELLETVQNKEPFYELAATHGLDIPQTQFHQVGDPVDLHIDRFPVILKPSNVVASYAHSFDGQEKIYRLNTEAEVIETITKYETSGYRDSLVIQEFIPGDDTYIWDAVLYLNTDAKAELVTLGQVALQEHEAQFIGAYTAIVSRYNRELMEQLKTFLEGIGYTGIANFDIKYDQRDSTFKVLEVNVRQGRSSYYTTQQGHNLARYTVEDLVYGRRKECTFTDKEVLFTVVPRYILKKYVTEETMRSDVLRLLRKRRHRNPLFYHRDYSPLRHAYLAGRNWRYGKRYANATWRDIF